MVPEKLPRNITIAQTNSEWRESVPFFNLFTAVDLHFHAGAEQSERVITIKWRYPF